MCGEGALDGRFCSSGDEFESSDEDARRLYWGWFDGERKYAVHKFAGDDVEEAAAFLEPGIAPGFYHGVGFVLIEALGDEHSFEFLSKRIDAARQIGRLQKRLVLQRAIDAETDFFAAAL